MIPGSNSFDTLTSLEVDGQEYHYFSLEKLAGQIPEIQQLPYSLKVLLENILISNRAAKTLPGISRLSATG